VSFSARTPFRCPGPHHPIDQLPELSARISCILYSDSYHPNRPTAEFHCTHFPHLVTGPLPPCTDQLPEFQCTHSHSGRCSKAGLLPPHTANCESFSTHSIQVLQDSYHPNRPTVRVSVHALLQCLQGLLPHPNRPTARVFCARTAFRCSGLLPPPGSEHEKRTGTDNFRRALYP
jgi:hypothetical protein